MNVVTDLGFRENSNNAPNSYIYICMYMLCTLSTGLDSVGLVNQWAGNTGSQVRFRKREENFSPSRMTIRPYDGSSTNADDIWSNNSVLFLPVATYPDCSVAGPQSDFSGNFKINFNLRKQTAGDAHDGPILIFCLFDMRRHFDGSNF